MPGAPDAEELYVNAAVIVNHFFVAFAVSLHIIHGDGTVGNMDVFGVNVHMIEEVFLHKMHIALLGFGLHGVVLVKVERHHIAKAEALFLVQAHQFGIHLYGRRSGGQAKHYFFAVLLFLTNGQCDGAGQMQRAGFGVIPDFDGYFF